VLTSPGIIFENLLIVVCRTPEALPAPPKDIRTYDVKTGELRWSLDPVPYCPLVTERVVAVIDHFDSQPFTTALPHQNRLQLAALYTLQNSLSGNAQFGRSFDHWQLFRRCFLHDA
jgi:hypothetical protein